MLILTGDVNREHGGGSATDDLYAEAAWRNAQIAGIAVYSICVRTGSDQAENAGQSNLLTLSNATGGHLYQQDAANSGSLRPLLEDLNVRLANQYRITFEPKNHVGAQRVRVQTDMPGMQLTAPNGVYVRQGLRTAAAKSGSLAEQQLAQFVP